MECASLKEEINNKWNTLEEKLKEIPDNSQGKKVALLKQQKELKKIAKRLRENETNILKRQTEDRTLFLMVAELLTAESGGLNPELISQIGFNVKSNNILDENRNMEELIYEKRVHADLPIKRYGEFRRFLKDRRLKDLVKYYDNDDLKLGTLASGETIDEGSRFQESTLVVELELYDLERINLIKEIHGFEKLIYDNYAEKSNGELKYDKSTKYIPHGAYLSVFGRLFPEYKDITTLNSSNYVFLRNKILHNEIPYALWIKEAIEKDTSDPIITRRIIRLAISLYQKMNSFINSKITTSYE